MRWRVWAGRWRRGTPAEVDELPKGPTGEGLTWSVSHLPRAEEMHQKDTERSRRRLGRPVKWCQHRGMVVVVVVAVMVWTPPVELGSLPQRSPAETTAARRPSRCSRLQSQTPGPQFDRHLAMSPSVGHAQPGQALEVLGGARGPPDERVPRSHLPERAPSRRSREGREWVGMLMVVAMELVKWVRDRWVGPGSGGKVSS